MIFRTFFEGFTKSRDMAGECVVLDRRLLPHELQELRFSDDPATLLDQNQEDFEGFRGERRVGMAPPEQALSWVDHEGTELVAPRFGRGPVRLHMGPTWMSAGNQPRSGDGLPQPKRIRPESSPFQISSQHFRRGLSTSSWRGGMVRQPGAFSARRRY